MFAEFLLDCDALSVSNAVESACALGVVSERSHGEMASHDTCKDQQDSLDMVDDKSRDISIIVISSEAKAESPSFPLPILTSFSQFLPSASALPPPLLKLL